MRLLGYIATAFGTFWAAAWLFGGKRYIGPSNMPEPPIIEFSYSDFISVTLSALGLILAALAIVIGVIAFRTLGEIKKEAGKIAEKHSKRTVNLLVPAQIEDKLDEVLERAGRAGVFDDAVERAIMKLMMGGGDTNDELHPDFDPDENREENNV